MIDFIKSFYYAFSGLSDALVSERNFRILWLIGLLIILTNFLISFNLISQVIFLLLIFIILALELINSALEKYCDSLEIGPSILIKKAKDFSAAAVLLLIIASALIFGILIQDNWLIIYENLKTQTWCFASLLLIALFNFPLCLKKLKTKAYILSLIAIILHIGILISYSGSLFYLGLSLLFHAGLIGAYIKQQNIC